MSEPQRAREVIGFIGLGKIGTPMAERLRLAGFELLIHDSRPEAMAPLREKGCRTAASPAELAAEADTVLLSLPTPAAVEGVVLGSQGIARGNRLTRVIDLSTSGPRTSQTVAAGLSRVGKVLWDSPVSGGPAGARAGTLALMLACPSNEIEAATSILRHLGKVFHVGERAGMGQTMKLVNNLMSAAALAISSEAVALGVKAGLAAQTVVEVCNAGSGRNSATLDKFPRAILPRAFNFGFTNGLMSKDVDLCLREAQALGLSLPVAQSVQETWARAVAEIGPEEDFTTIVKLMEHSAGVEFRGAAL
jgi:3-hydroxyisobutyrate dehydrogenase-like beta-hydroxyacid dehydrogenase